MGAFVPQKPSKACVSKMPLPFFSPLYLIQKFSDLFILAFGQTQSAKADRSGLWGEQGMAADPDIGDAVNLMPVSLYLFHFP